MPRRRTSLTAWVCLLLFLFGSTVQAVHTHGSPTKAAKAQVSAETGLPHAQGEELCPLCAAMHGALASPATPAFLLAAQEIAKAAATPDVARTRAWSFELFGRPPPANL